MQAKYANTNLLLPSKQLLGNSAEASQAQGPIVDQFVSAPLPRDQKLALVDDWDCLRVISRSICPGSPVQQRPESAVQGGTKPVAETGPPQS